MLLGEKHPTKWKKSLWAVCESNGVRLCPRHEPHEIGRQSIGVAATIISDKPPRVIAQMSEAQTLQIAKSMFRYAMELIMQMVFENYRLYSKRN